VKKVYSRFLVTSSPGNPWDVPGSAVGVVKV